MVPDLTNLLADFPKSCIFKLFSPVFLQKNSNVCDWLYIVNYFTWNCFSKVFVNIQKVLISHLQKKLISLNYLEFKKISKIFIQAVSLSSVTINSGFVYSPDSASSLSIAALAASSAAR